MKVLLVSPLPPPVGGIATLTSSLEAYFKLNNVGIDITIINTSHASRPITSTSIIWNTVTGLLNTFRILRQVSTAIRNDRPHVIHIASSASVVLVKDILLVRLAAARKIPVIMHWHFGRIPMLARSGNWEWKAFRHVVRKSSVSIVLDAASLHALLNEGMSGILRIPNPLALDVETRARMMKGIDVQRKEGSVIFVGHIIRGKGVYELVEACVTLSLVRELWMIGPFEEPDRNELTRIARRRDNGNWLFLPGTLSKDQVLDHMLKNQILALPSYTEGFPVVILEAMAMGCAVIATPVGAIPEIMGSADQSPCGILVPPKDEKRLQDAIQNLIQDPVKAQAMGRNGRQRVLENYTFGRIAAYYRNAWMSTAGFVVPDSQDPDLTGTLEPGFNATSVSNTFK